MILAGDIGGTKTHLALFADPTGARAERVAGASYASRDHAHLVEILEHFLGQNGTPEIHHAAFGIAGPIIKQRVETTNLPWVIDGPALQAALGARSVVLLNDLEANAQGIAMLGPEDFAVLQQGAPGATGTRAVIAAGTGLGEAGLYWDGRRHRPFASEGGHADFSPSNPGEDELLLYLRERFGPHVSWERVLSGPGLLNLYEFLRDTERGTESSRVRQAMLSGDPGAIISSEALHGTDPLCERALDLFIRLYGAEAGNLALKLLSTGGVFIGGGIAPKNLPRMLDGRFLAAFLDKGRLRPVLEAMSVSVILNQETALLGAARCALDQAEMEWA